MFGENHDKMVEEALKPRKAVKQSDKKMVSKEEEPHGSEQTAAGGRGRKNLDLKGKEKEEFEADVSSVGSEDEQASGSEHSEHEEEEAFAAGPSNKRNKRFLEGEDLEEPLPKRREAKKTVRFQVPEDDLPCWSEIEVETEV